jgi:hypothetical protein
MQDQVFSCLTEFYHPSEIRNTKKNYFLIIFELFGNHFEITRFIIMIIRDIFGLFDHFSI